MRQLFLMVEGRRREDWDHTAQLIAMIHNASMNCEKPIKPADIHPFEDYYPEAPRNVVEQIPFSLLKNVLF